MSVLLLSDLDGTLLTPARDRADGDVPVEMVRGRDASFLTPRTVALLRRMPTGSAVIPVTSRSVEQYLRIRWPAGTEPGIAAVANGGVLLVRRRPLAGWRDPLPADVLASLESLRDRLAARYGGICRVVDGCYAYLSREGGPDPEDSAYAESLGLSVRSAGRKWYFLPAGMDKADAACRFRAVAPGASIAAAGDGPMDAGMLSAADEAFVPSGGIAGFRGTFPECPPGRRFPEWFLESFLSRSARGTAKSC